MRRPSATLLALCCAAPTIAVLAALPASAAAPAFDSGNIVVEQVGANGSTTAGTSAATAVTLDEFTDPASGTATMAQQVALPTTASGNQLALTTSGSATSEGQITDSKSGGLLLVPGYNAPVGTAGIASTTPSGQTNARVIGAVTSTGAVDTSTYNDSNSKNNIRSATADDYTFLTTGAVDGVQTQAIGTTTSTAKTPKANLRVSHLSGVSNTLFSTTGSAAGGAMAGIDVADATSGALTNIVADANPYGFALAKTGTGENYLAPDGSGTVDSGIDTIYLADPTSGITKYVVDANNTFAADGSVTTSSGVYGLAVKAGTGGNEIFATSSTALYKLVDSSGVGALTGTPMTLATTTSGAPFRGVALAPTSTALPAAPSPSLPEAPYAVLLPLIGLSAVGVIAVRRSVRQ